MVRADAQMLIGIQGALSPPYQLAFEHHNFSRVVSNVLTMDRPRGSRRFERRCTIYCSRVNVMNPTLAKHLAQTERHI